MLFRTATALDGGSTVPNKRSMAQASQGSLSKKLHIKTFGCQMNAYDSERMAEALAAGGLCPDRGCRPRPISSSSIPATSGRRPRRRSIRSSAASGLSRKRRRAGPRHADRGRRLRRAGRGAEIMARAQRRHRGRAAELSSPADSSPRPAHRQEACSPRISRPRTNSRICPSAHAAKAQISAFVTVQEGCDKFCTFCVVPYTRGAEFSRTPVEIVAEVERLARTRNARNHPARAERQCLSRRRPRRARVVARQAVAAARRGAIYRAAPLHDEPPARHGR